MSVCGEDSVPVFECSDTEMSNVRAAQVDTVGITQQKKGSELKKLCVEG